MNRLARWLLVAVVGVGGGCGRRPEGTVLIRIPDAGLRSLAWVSVRGDEKGLPFWTTSNAASVVSASLPAGAYRVKLGFANSNYKPTTEVDAGPIVVAPAATNAFACGLLAFDVPRELPDLNLEAIHILGRNGGPGFDLRSNGNTYYFFLPKPLPPGAYDVAIEYYRSAGPSLIATGVVVRAGAETVVKLDTGLALRPPPGAKVTGWSLTREGSAAPWLAVHRGHDNDEPLWRRFMVPAGTYRLALERGASTTNAAVETVTIEPGQVRVHTPAP